MKNALIIRYTPTEGVAGYRQAVEEAGYAITRIDVADPKFPETDLIVPDLLIMMGGPMGVYEQEAYPWIPPHLARLAERLAAGKPTLGACLGSQMMAAAMGGKVYPGPIREIGFHPIEPRQDLKDSPLHHLRNVPVLHWHGDTFDLPENVELLASSPLYANQAFRRGRNILALQFHGEMGLDPRFYEWIESSGDWLRGGGVEPDDLVAAHDAHGPAAVAAGRLMVAEWLQGLDV